LVLKRLILIISFVVIFSPPLWGDEDPSAPQGQPEVKIAVPKSYKFKKAAFFPLEIPHYALYVATYPIGKGFEYLEEKQVVGKVESFLSNSSHTAWFYPIIDVGGGYGLNFGVGYKNLNLFNKRYVLDADYRFSISLNQYVNFSLTNPKVFYLFGKRASYTVTGKFKRELNSDYYGIGSSTPQGDHSEFAINQLSSSFILDYNLSRMFITEINAGIIAAMTESSTKDSNPSVNTTFPGSELAGFDRWVDYFNVGISLTNDTTDKKKQPNKGGVRSISFQRYQNINSRKFNYNSLTFDVAQYFPLFRPEYIFKVRNAWTFETPTGGGSIPFYRLATLDGSSPLRSFSRGRFKDKSSVIFNFEYIFPIWSTVAGILFYDTGRVFNRVTGFSFDAFKHSVGGGLDFHMFDIMLAKFRVAYGNEGFVTTFGISKFL